MWVHNADYGASVKEVAKSASEYNAKNFGKVLGEWSKLKGYSPVTATSNAGAVRTIRSAGAGNVTVGSFDEAVATIRKAMPDAVVLPKAIDGLPYPSPPSSVKSWIQVHPPEPGVGNNLPHIKYADWRNGKKGTGGSWGHIFFTE